MKYHINPETGRAGQCTAKKRCRFGLSDDQHYDNKEDARAAYEKAKKDSILSVTTSKKKYSTAELEEWVKKLPTRFEVLTPEDFEKAQFLAVEKKMIYLVDQEFEETQYRNVKKFTFVGSKKITRIESTAYISEYDDDNYSAEVKLIAKQYSSHEDYTSDKNYETITFRNRDEVNNFNRVTNNYGSRLAYDHWDADDTANAAKNTLDTLYPSVVIMNAVSARKATSIEWMNKNASNESDLIRSSLASNLNLSDDLKIKLSKDLSDDVKLSLIQDNVNLPEEALESLLGPYDSNGFHNYYRVCSEVREWALRHPSLTAKQQSHEAKTCKINELYRLAANPKLTKTAKKIILMRAPEFASRLS